MRNFKRANQEEETEIDITPMLDVVFIMLIFFIVTATFVKEAGVDVFKPQAKQAEAISAANILIAIDSNDQVWIDGAPVDITAITANVKRLRAENPKGTVVIQADKDSTHNMLLEVHDSARSAGVDGEIAISTEGN
jgi:biopolymer transport protein ExbD